MEKYSQYRDRGSGIAPFFPIPAASSGINLPLHLFLFSVRIFFLIPAFIFYFAFLSWLPLNALVKKGALWILLGIPGIWWVDLQIDGVRRGSLGKSGTSRRLPHPGTIIASSFTSPIDSLYLAAIFDPIFTASYPNTRFVQRITLFQAMVRALLPPEPTPPRGAKLTSLSALVAENPGATIAIFPECTTTNGRGILPFSPALLSVSPKTKIFPVSLRYTPADITTPVPGTYLQFVWNLCSRPTHCIRVRIAEAVYNTSKTKSQFSVGAGSGADQPAVKARKNSYQSNFFDELHIGEKVSSSDTLGGESESDEGLGAEEKRVLERIGEDLARLGRVKRVGLGVKDKQEFINDWTRKRR
ncbi:hypothetical protein W97_03601 [Coniosporium apollinis CBS 100218]|uniref:Phospholipid/glycerol acyltransferase domain-containing protein n=1 Tax=Coniosporium apollinis (strain CBS 100218) TaxID=1168221 RepID=R7YR19_CONA1|nr:uncharacterized protein W97_03601 [Coniosporium apollinis CBS 100218]EON64370.1 hypothetical protein W97_03601 [Coniosporium apollinis CBS 100218]